MVNLDEGMDNDLKQIKELVAENNKILKGMRRNARIAGVWHFIYWIFIIGSLVASYYYLQPYIDKLTETYKSMQATQQKISDTTQSFSLQGIKNYLWE